MYIANNWTEYKLIDASDGMRLESWSGHILVRPDPQVIWKDCKKSGLWQKADAKYNRSSNGGGAWEKKNLSDEEWITEYAPLGIKFVTRPMNFKHTGVFPEQAVNWDWMHKLIKNADREIKVLNLFAYTGGATLACAKAGAAVCHVDAAKGMVAQARKNASLSGLENAPIRWIVDDCRKFVEREIRRGNKYDAIIMDPPSYGRGPSGEVWRLEDNIYEFVKLCSELLSDKPLFVLINSYTTGLSPSTMGYILKMTVADRVGGVVSCDEVGLPIEVSGGALPCGAASRWTAELQ